MVHPDYNKGIFPYWSSIKIRYRDLDPLNHVNNAIFSTYYEEARINLISEVPRLLEQIDLGYSFVLASLNIDFIKPAEFPGNLLIGSGIKELGNTSITSFQAIYNSENKTLLSVAEASGVWFNLEKQQPARVPKFEHREQFVLDKELFV